MLALSGADRALITLGPVTVGVLLGVVLPPIARWLLDLGIGLPFGVVFKVAGRMDTWWEVGVQAGILGGLGLLASAEMLRRSVRVTVAEEGTRLTVEVTDDGPSPPARRHRTGYGLLGMRERVESLGGTFSAGPGAAGGWSVRAVLPR